MYIVNFNLYHAAYTINIMIHIIKICNINGILIKYKKNINKYNFIIFYVIKYAILCLLFLLIYYLFIYLYSLFYNFV